MTYKAYEAYLSVAQSSPKDYYKDYYSRFIDDNFNDSISFETIIHNGVSVDVRVVGVFAKETPARRIEDYQKIIFKSADYIVKIGDLFEFGGFSWLCVDTSGSYVGKSCMVIKCNSTISIFKNGQLYTIPCAVETQAKLYSMTLEQNRHLTEVEDVIIVRVSDNSITDLIQINDIYKIGKRWNYKVTNLSDVIEPGILLLKMQIVPEQQNFPTFSINILNGNNLEIQENSTLQLNVQVLADNTPLSPIPNLIYESSDETILTVDENGLITSLDNIDSATITVKLASDTSISSSVIVNVIENVVDNYTVSINGVNSINRGSTTNYSCVFKNNGLPITEQSVFYLLADDGVNSTTLAEIVSQDSVANTCVVKGNNVGYVRLFVRNIDNTIVGDGFRIQIRNLF